MHIFLNIPGICKTMLYLIRSFSLMSECENITSFQCSTMFLVHLLTYKLIFLKMLVKNERLNLAAYVGILI